MNCQQRNKARDENIRKRDGKRVSNHRFGFVMLNVVHFLSSIFFLDQEHEQQDIM